MAKLFQYTAQAGNEVGRKKCGIMQSHQNSKKRRNFSESQIINQELEFPDKEEAVKCKRIFFKEFFKI